MNTQPANDDIQIYQPDAQVGEMKLWRPPDQVLAEAKQAADALFQMIAKSNIKPVPFGDREHLRLEHWETLGHFFGYCTKIEATNYIEFEGDGGAKIRGYEATAQLLNERTGAVVGRVDSMCLDDEEQWGDVPAYETQDQMRNGKPVPVRVQVGFKPKPLFQLRSMAQTRSSSKAYRMKLAWVAVLAGYSGTPAEEMVNDYRPKQESLPEKLERKQKPLTPEYPSPTQPQTQANRTPPRANRPASADRVISEAKARRFYAIWKGSGKTREQVTNYLRTQLGIESDLQIPDSRYNEACHWAQS